MIQFSIRVDIQSQKLVYSISADILKMIYKRMWSLSISDGLVLLVDSLSQWNTVTESGTTQYLWPIYIADFQHIAIDQSENWQYWPIYQQYLPKMAYVAIDWPNFWPNNIDYCHLSPKSAHRYPLPDLHNCRPLIIYYWWR